MRSLDVSNGENIGISLFVQGCPFMCKNCFNSETWDFNGGKEWTEETKKEFLDLIDRPYIKRVSILGGEPLAEQNLNGVLDLITTIREKYPIFEKSNPANPYKMGVSEVENSEKIRVLFPEKTIWLYTGFSYPEIFRGEPSFLSKKGLYNYKRRQIISACDVIVDGKYIDSQRDITLKYRGSKNQRVIDVQESLKQWKTVLYCE